MVFLAFSIALPTPSIGQYRFLGYSGLFHNGAESSYMSSSPTRVKIDLEGPWSYAVDGGPSGSTLIPASYDFVGRVSFQRSFQPPAEMDLQNYRFHLVAYGINNTAEITINNDLIANHAGGYTSIAQLIPRNTIQQTQENLVRVVVNNDLDVRRTIPLRPQVWGWRNYGGIQRDIYILATPQVYLRDVAISTELLEKNNARVSFRAYVEGMDSVGTTLGVYFELFDKISGLPVGRSSTVTFTKDRPDARDVTLEAMVTGPKLWSPDSPELYLMRCFVLRVVGKESSVIDELDLNCGIRQAGVAGGHIQLNGKRVNLKGVVWNEDSPVSGAALSYEERERDVVLMKNLGANAIRFIGRPPHPYMLDLCDRYGLFALVELPIVETPGAVFGDPVYLEQAVTLMREMVTRDRSHASVLAWGLGDEFDVLSPASRGAVEALATAARSIDKRPLYYGSLPLATDDCSDLVDFAAVNLHTQDLKELRSQLEKWKARHPSQPVIVSKFGTEVTHENRRGSSDPLSQEAQARFYLQRLETIRSLDYDGAFVWAFNDWRGDRASLTVASGSPWMHTLGLVSAEREKRLAYDAVKATYHGEKISALPIGNYSSSAPIVYVLSGFAVLVLIAYLYNANRRFRENLNRSVLNSFNFYADVRDRHSVSLLHTTLVGCVVSLATGLVLSSILYHFREDRIVDNALSMLLISDVAKAMVVRLIWHPLESIAFLSAIIFTGLVLFSGVVHSTRIFFRNRIFSFHAYAVTLWSVSPLLVFIPVGMILYRVMESEMYVVPSLIVVGLVLLWAFLRLLKGAAIIFDVPALKMYAIGLLSIGVLMVLAYFYYDYTVYAPVYLKSMYNAAINTL